LFVSIQPLLEGRFRVDLSSHLSRERGDDNLLIEDRADRVERFVRRWRSGMEILRQCRLGCRHRENERLIVGEFGFVLQPRAKSAGLWREVFVSSANAAAPPAD
jgi:hypothetical protein